MLSASKFRFGTIAATSILLMLGLCGVSTSSAAPAAPPKASAPKLKLLWHEEYNGKKGIPSTVQTSKRAPKKYYNWVTTVTGAPANKERQYYTDGVVSYNPTGSIAHRAIELDGKGNLAFNAVKPQAKTAKHPSTAAPDYCFYGKCEYLSGRMETNGKIGFKFGQIEARIKIPTGEGTWPAFWMLGANINEYGSGWPQCGEIDIMEASYSNRYGSMFGSLHSYPDDGFGITSSTYPDNFYSKYHTYGIRWVYNKIDFMVDGVIYNTITKADVVSEKVSVENVGMVTREYPFNNEFFLILNLAMGGTLGGNYDGEVEPKSAKGGTMLVDYIRFYSVNGTGKLIRH